MSHRDKDCRTTSRTYAQELSGVLEGLLADIDWSGVQFRKDCRWSGRGLAMAALIWAWSARTTLKDRFEQSMKFMEPLSRRLAPASSSPQAFMKLLVRWTSELRQLLIGRFQRMMELQLAVEFLQENFVVFAGDGSKLQLARTRSNQARYSPAKSKKRKGKKRRARRPNSAKARAKRARQQKADSPQMALTLMYHVGLRLPWDWRLGPYDSSERDHLREMIPGLPANALVVADAGFVGYEFWSDLLASGRQFIIRAGGNVRLLKNLGVVRETQGLVYLWPDMAAKRRQPPLQLRLVVVHDGRQPWYLVTSVRDPRRLSDRQVAQIYRRRWRIEIFQPKYAGSEEEGYTCTFAYNFVGGVDGSGTVVSRAPRRLAAWRRPMSAEKRSVAPPRAEQPRRWSQPPGNDCQRRRSAKWSGYWLAG